MAHEEVVYDVVGRVGIFVGRVVSNSSLRKENRLNVAGGRAETNAGWVAVLDGGNGFEAGSEWRDNGVVYLGSTRLRTIVLYGER